MGLFTAECRRLSPLGAAALRIISRGFLLSAVSVASCRGAGGGVGQGRAHPWSLLPCAGTWWSSSPSAFLLSRAWDAPWACGAPSRWPRPSPPWWPGWCTTGRWGQKDKRVKKALPGQRFFYPPARSHRPLAVLYLGYPGNAGDSLLGEGRVFTMKNKTIQALLEGREGNHQLPFLWLSRGGRGHPAPDDGPSSMGPAVGRRRPGKPHPSGLLRPTVVARCGHHPRGVQGPGDAGVDSG